MIWNRETGMAIHPAITRQCNRAASVCQSVSARADNGDEATSDTTWFETAKMGQACQVLWITPQFDKDTHPIIFRDIGVSENVGQSRI